MNLIPVNRPVVSETDTQAVLDALTGTFISGETPQVRLMEQRLADFLGQKFGVAVSNGSVALDLAVEALNLPEKSECVVPTFTIISSVSQLMRKNHRLTLVDSDPIHWSMNAETAAETINSRTRLVLPVHIYGLTVDMDPILEAAERFGTFVLEDAAEALGVEYKNRKAGGIAMASTHSFYANKTVTGGEGGAVVSNDERFASRVRFLRNLCFEPEERFVHRELGWNNRISGLSAALIASQLTRITSLIEIKRQIAAKYIEGLSGHPWFSFMPQETNFSKNGYWVFPILLNEYSPYSAKDMQNELRKRDIETRRFFCPIHLQPVAKGYDFQLAGSMKVAENLWEKGFYLPSGVGTLDSDIDQVIDACWELTKK
jgi:perosamine synthetase